MLKSIIGATCAYLAIVSFNVNAAVFIYDEAIDGDLSGQSTNAPIFNFGIGENTISGSGKFIAGTPYQTDMDHFSFILPSSSQLSSVTFSFDAITLNDTHSLSTTYTLFDGDFFTSNPIGNETIFMESETSPLSLFAESLPILAGTKTYGFLNTGIGTDWPYGSPYTTHGGSWDYTIVLDVNVVPIPSAVWLFGSGLIGLIGFARRKA